MPYRKKPSTVERMKNFLDVLIEKDSDVAFGTENPERLAFKLREAIHVALIFDEFEKYHVLASKFSFSERDGQVLCSYRGGMNPYVLTKEERALRESPDHVDRRKRHIGKADEAYVPQKLTLDMSFSSPRAIVGAVIKYKARAQEIYFPNAQLAQVDLEMLHSWSRDFEEGAWKLILHDDRGITLTQDDVPETILWNPNEEES